MKFKIKTSVLKKWLDIVNHATASISTTPILENILLKVNFKNIVLISNNLEMAIEYVIEEELEIEKQWSLCVPSKIFTSYVSLLEDDFITISLDGNSSIKIESESSKIKINWIDASEFPLIPTIKEELVLSIDWKTLKEAIEKTIFSSAEWNIRPTLAGIFVEISWKDATFASTDSYRLSEYKSQIKETWKNSFSHIIPSKTANQIKWVIWNEEEIKIISSDNQIVFIFWKSKIFSRLLNWKFPDYRNFFPNSYSTKAEINRIDLIWALKKINLVSKENNYSIKMSFSWELWILLETSETQIWEWSVKLNWSIEWEDNIIWINSTYFIEALWVIESSHIKISFESPLSPILIEPSENKKYSFKHIIMPLKI